MLQPRQLREVSEQYPDQIAEVRDFLNKAGVVVQAPDALRVVSARLTQDRAFHRDLTSNIWVVLDRSRQQISYSDLLGVVAIAAAGVDYASMADENAAHDLLRFLMEARHSLEVFAKPATAATPVARPSAQVAASEPVKPAAPLSEPSLLHSLRAPSAQPAASARRGSSLSAALAAAQAPLPDASLPPAVEPAPVQEKALPVPPEPAPPSDEAVPATELEVPALAVPEPVSPALNTSAALRPESPELPAEDLVVAAENDRRRSRIAWIGAFICIVALALGAWQLHNTSAAKQTENTPAPVVDGITSGALPPDTSQPASQPATSFPQGGSSSQHSLQHNARPQPVPYARPQAATEAAPAVRNESRPATPSPWYPPAASGAPEHGGSSTSNGATTPSSVGGTSSRTAVAPLSTGAPIIRTAARPTGGAVIVPEATLSKRLDSPRVPADSLVQNQAVADGRKYPRLLRRKGGTRYASDDDEELIATVRPTDAPVLPYNRGSSTASAPQGIVRPTAVGMMAGNVLYSPAPVYPAAASAAHVQGQVKIQAQVDRDGNVAWARVVSGPPLLRDAALDAVQHWRYRPYTAGGKPAPASASAVLDFELP